ncbi:MAG TPA: CvpA family protein [Candidatus Dormibacteraeota bacterium]|nr:CvpA family protein [Candidatus Dormibacteraeota bacterium]
MLADLDTTPLRITADVLLLALVGINVWLGIRYGFVRRLFGMAGLFLGCLAATYGGNSLAALVDPHSLYANAWFFVGIVAAVVLIAEIMGYLYQERLQRLVVVMFDRITGAVAGALVGFFEASVAFLVAIAVAAVPAANATVPPDRGNAGNAVKSAMLSGLAVRAAPGVETVFGPVLPANLASHLADGTQVVPAAR